MTAARQTSAPPEWAQCFAATERDRTNILALPSSTWQADARLLVLLAASLREPPSANPALALEYLDAADRLAGGPPWIPVVARVVRSDALRARRRYPEASAALAEARALVTASTLDIADRVGLSGVIHVRSGIAALHVGDLSAAADSLTQGLSVIDGLPDVRVEATGALALIAFLVGRLDRAREHLAELTGGDRSRLCMVPAALTEALLAVEAEPAGVRESTVREVGQRCGETEYSALLFAVEAIAMEAEGALEGVPRVLWQLDELAHEGTGHDLASILGLSVWLGVMAARGEIASALGAVRAIPSDATHALCPAGWEARLLLETGEFARALAATSACTLLGPTHALRTLVYVLGVIAVAHAGLRDWVSADAAFARALSLAALTGLRRYFVTLPAASLSDLLTRAAAADLPESSHRVVIEVASMLPVAIQAPRSILSERERIVLRHLALGESLTVIAWRLSVSMNTVKSQTRSIYRKLGVGTRHSAVERGRVLGFVE